MEQPSKEAQLLIKPVSHSCNLACSYCFYKGSSKKKEVMSAKILSAVVQSFLGLKQKLSIFSWQGGEPTLAGLDFFENVVRMQSLMGEDGQAIGNSIQTNGILLTKEWARFLSYYRFLVGLSIDGPAKIHNRYRNSKTGKGSHAKALKAAELLREWEIPFSVLVAVHKFSSAGHIYSWLREKGFDSLQFIPIVENGPGPGKMADFTMEPENYGEFLCELFDLWWPEREKVFIRDFESLVSRLSGLHSGVCVLEESCGSYLVIEADGSVYPCDFFVREDMCLGNITVKTLPELLNSTAFADFAQGKGFVPQSCEPCEWLSICACGCQKDRERAGDRRGTSYLCNSNKIFLKHSMPRLRELARYLKLID